MFPRQAVCEEERPPWSGDDTFRFSLRFESLLRDYHPKRNESHYQSKQQSSFFAVVGDALSKLKTNAKQTWGTPRLPRGIQSSTSFPPPPSLRVTELL
jgi:hypothetical protein